MSALAIFLCLSPVAADGDTLRCANHPQAVRLIAVDAPELKGCNGKAGRVCASGDGRASKRFLQLSLDAGPVTIIPHRNDLYGRLVATVRLVSGQNASCAIIASGNGIFKPDWGYRRQTARECGLAI
jgi:endonuclease YncB( thermonuclease family)